MQRLSNTPNDSPIPTDIDLAPGEHRLANGHIVLVPDFDCDINNASNAHLISQALFLVFTEQSDINSSLFKLHFSDVEFTLEDVQFLAKATFCSWKSAYKHETKDEEKEKAA
ncbi:hypothetical protein EW145_g7499 [Phellinidium pouzarii]|uniref:Uncharacterized protein n=1 Tax=Phellinidium pouzarii TaxID=167371 RepID=A0A4S4KI60_9AGAM|nr:hypothetical protein EW145_g7499 [Phellinidium pouzarii]